MFSSTLHPGNIPLGMSCWRWSTLWYLLLIFLQSTSLELPALRLSLGMVVAMATAAGVSRPLRSVQLPSIAERPQPGRAAQERLCLLRYGSLWIPHAQDHVWHVTVAGCVMCAFSLSVVSTGHSGSAFVQPCSLASGSCPPMCTCSNNIVDCRGRGLTAIPAHLPEAMTEMWVPGRVDLSSCMFISVF